MSAHCDTGDHHRSPVSQCADINVILADCLYIFYIICICNIYVQIYIHINTMYTQIRFTYIHSTKDN